MNILRRLLGLIFPKQKTGKIPSLGDEWRTMEKIPVPENMMSLREVVETLEKGVYAFSAHPEYVYNTTIFDAIREWALDGILTVKGHEAAYYAHSIKWKRELVAIPPDHWIKNEICWYIYWTTRSSITKIEDAHFDRVKRLPDGRAEYWDPYTFADGQYTGLRFDRAEVAATLGQGPRKK